MRWGRALVAVAVATLALLPGDAARGDWPVGRHDPQRTGAADGRSDIVEPETIWRYYLGGALNGSGAAAAHVDGDGVEEYVIAAGGALVARRFDDTVAWRVPPRDIQTVIGISDLDGDGGEEIVVGAARSVLVVDIATGAIEWETPAGLMGMLGGVRMADLDSDGLDDLLIVECGTCCTTFTGWPGAAYGFAAGADQPVELWQIDHTTCVPAQSLTVFDSDGDGDLEVLVGSGDWFQLLDGATGVEVARTTDLGTAVQLAQCKPIDVDAAPGDELACILNYPYYAADRSVFVLDFDGADLEVRWRRFLTATSDDLRTVELAADLGGGPRLFFATRSGPTAVWTTTVVDAASGVQRDLLSNELLVGTTPRGDGGRYLMTANDDGLHGWRDDGGILTEAWTREGDEDPLYVVDRAVAMRGDLASRPAVLPSTGRLLVVPRSAVNTLRAVSLDDDGSAIEAQVTMPIHVKIAAGFVFPEIAARPFAVARSDGYLTPLGENLTTQLGLDDVQLYGIRTGGFYATGSFRQLGGPPRAADLDGDDLDEIIAVDARGALVRLDPEDGSLTVPPTPNWVIAEATAPAVTTDADGNPAIACIERDTADPLVPTYSVSLRAPDAALLWSTMLPGPPLTDVVPGSFDGDDVPDLVVQWGAPGDVLLHTSALDGTSGAQLWEEISDPGAGRYPAGVATGPWTGQEPDVVVAVGASRVTALSGATSAPVAQSAAFGPMYFLPMLVDVDDDPALEIALTGGFEPIRLLDDDLQTAWASTDTTQHPYPYGSLARCPDGRAILISQSWEHPSRLTLTTLSLGGRGEERTLWLAGGSAYATEALLGAAGVWAGQLTSSTVHQDLSGAGRPSALVGSSDGYLYLVDPCAGGLDTSIQFDAAVGEAVYADTDGDGKDEILVTAGDGELHAIQNHSIDAPAAVHDLDVDRGGDDDVDLLSIRTTAAARWDAVDGATGYQAALVDRSGQYATDPPWRDVSATRIVYDDFETRAPGFYRVAVRAVGPDGHSVDIASDGVTTFDPDANGSADGGCCDSGGSTPGPASLLLAGLAVLLMPRRRAGRGRS